MKSSSLLGRFITFILLLGLPTRRAAISGNFIYARAATASLLPLTRFLRTTLDRVRAHELSQAPKPAEVGRVFRIGQPEYASGDTTKEPLLQGSAVAIVKRN